MIANLMCLLRFMLPHFMVLSDHRLMFSHRMIRVRIRTIKSLNVVNRRHMFDFIMSCFRMLSLMVNNFFFVHWLMMLDFLLLDNRLLFLSFLLFMSIKMALVVNRLKSRLVDDSSMKLWLTIYKFLIWNLVALFVVENRHVRAASLMIFLSFANLRYMSHLAMIFN